MKKRLGDFTLDEINAECRKHRECKNCLYCKEAYIKMREKEKTAAELITAIEMDIFIKNFNINFNCGKAEASRAKAPRTEAEEKTAGVVETRIYTLEEFKKCKDIVKDGDGVKLPKIIVEAKTIDGNGRKMNFPFLEIQDTARVIKNENGKIDLVFQHCLFESAIDYNGIDEFDATQLGIYLAGEFLKAMQAAGIPATKCGLLSKDEVFGDNALPFFKDGRNRIAFDLEEKEMWSYWLSTLASSVIFCRANDYGSSYYANASYAHSYVRPRFVIE